MCKVLIFKPSVLSRSHYWLHKKTQTKGPELWIPLSNTRLQFSIATPLFPGHTGPPPRAFFLGGGGDCGNWAFTVLQWLSELQLSNRFLTQRETHRHTQTCTHMRVGLRLLPQGFKRNVRYFPSCKWYSIIPLIVSLSPIYTGMHPYKPRKYHTDACTRKGVKKLSA